MCDADTEKRASDLPEFRRTGTFDVFAKNEWFNVSAALCDDRIDLTLHEPLERFSAGQNDFDVPDLCEDFASRKRTVHIQKKSNEGLGISIKGGKENRMPILISKIFRGLAADLTGEIYVGDAIISVNDKNLREATHEQAVEILKNSGEVVTLEVRYLPEVVPYFRKANILSDIGWTSEENEKKTDEQMRTMHGMDSETEHQSESLSTGNQGPHSADSKSIPLYGAFVRRLYLTKLLASPGGHVLRGKGTFSPDTECDAVTSDASFSDSSLIPQEVIVIQSPSLSRACILRFDSEVKCSSWFCAIQKAIAQLNLPTIYHLNQNVHRDIFDDAQVVHMSWFLEWKDSPSPMNDETADDMSLSAFDRFEYFSRWKPVFLIQTTRDLYFYESFPMNSGELSRYSSSWSLLQSRLIYQSAKSLPYSTNNGNIPTKRAQSKSSSKSSSISSLQEVSKMSITSTSTSASGAIPIKFALRFGTSLGIETKILCVQTFSELSQLSSSIIRETHETIRKLQIITFPCLKENTESIIVLNYREGIKVMETLTGTVTHRIPFTRLHSTSDDGQRFICLHYEPDNKLQLNLLQNPKPFVFILHSFLAALTTELVS